MKFKIQALVGIVSIIFASGSNAQLFTKPLPKAWVSKAESIERKTWFRFGEYKPGAKSKAEVFRKKIGADMPDIFYSNASVNKLLEHISKVTLPFTHINIYITAFYKDASCPATLPVIPDKEILLVFSPAKEEGESTDRKYKDVGKYFVIVADGTIHEIDATCMVKWNENYYENFIKGSDGLESTINPNDIENRLPGTTTVSDTKRITYPYNEFQEFWSKERTRLIEKRKIDLIGIRADFAEYTDLGKPDEAKRGTYRYRLHLQFEFVMVEDGNKKYFYHEHEKNFSRRLKKYWKRYPGSAISKLTGNHGQLCPTQCE